MAISLWPHFLAHPVYVSITSLWSLYEYRFFGILNAFLSFSLSFFSYFAFSANLLVGRQEGHLACKKTEWWGAGVVISLERRAHLHMVQLMPLPLTISCSSKVQIGFIPFWYRLTRVVLGKEPLNGCVCVCVCARVCLNAFLRCVFVYDTHPVFSAVSHAACCCHMAGDAMAAMPSHHRYTVLRRRPHLKSRRLTCGFTRLEWVSECVDLYSA